MSNAIVACVGGGASGLLSAKALKEAGLRATVFEASPYVGGLWSPDSQHLSQSLTTNVSKYICSFSDFPWEAAQAQVPTFPSATQLGTYLKAYADRFLDPESIRLYSKVTTAEFSDQRSQWHIQYERESGGRIDHPLPLRKDEAYFDFLVIASGYFGKPHIPAIPGISTLKCQVYHYSQAEILLSQGLLDLDGKSVAVIGGSLSGVELTGTLHKYNPRRILHIVKRPLWVLPLLLPEDPQSPAPAFVPLDLALMAKIPKKPPNTENSVPLTVEESNRLRNAHLRRFVGDQSQIAEALKVEDDDTAFIGVSDSYAELVRNGDIEYIRGELVEINEGCLKISQKAENGESLQIDIPSVNVVVIFATGFSTELPFFSAQTLENMQFEAKDLFQPLLLANAILHPKLPQAAFVGMYRGPYFAVMEMQARYAASLFSGKIPWPSLDAQLESIAKEAKIRNRFPRSQFPHPNYVESVNEHVKFGSLYERPEEDYAIAAKYSDSPEATSILESFHSDLHVMRQGRFVPAVVFRNLAGKWELENSDAGSDFVNARFSRILSETCTGISAYAYFEYNVELEGYEYDDALETLFVSKRSVRAPIVFKPELAIGWKGNATLEFGGKIWNYEFTFPFAGVYFPSFTKKVTCSQGGSPNQETVFNYRRPLTNCDTKC